MVSKKLSNPLSFQDIINRLIKLQFLKWGQIISCWQEEVVKILEQILPVPYITINRLDKVTETAVKQHLQTWVDGEHTIGDIAENLKNC